MSVPERLVAGADGNRRPVLVWLHGSAFTMGSGSTPLYDGTSFAQRGDVVVVTLNYRLGAPGFLYLDELPDEPYSGSGNNGLLDQIAALQWLHDNIAAFGGDPDRVTIFGESAGAMSVGTLLAMPAAKGLFRQAILQSGAASSVRGREAAAQVTREYLDALGLKESEAGALATLPLADLMAAQTSVLSKQRTLLAFGPVVDGSSLPQPPLEAVADGATRDIVMLIGTNHDEMRLFNAANPTPPDERLLRRFFGDEAERVIATYSASRPEASPSPPYNTEQRATMLFNTRCEVVNDPEAAERRVWENSWRS